MKFLANLVGLFPKRSEAFRDRLPLTTLDFCGRCNFTPNSSALVDDFRRAFANVVSVNPELIFPEDEAAMFGIDYSDDLAMFLFDEGLLTNERFHYDFPMEEASSVGDIIRLTLELNAQAEHVVGGNGG